jgi:hypothetical protein
MLPAHYVRLFGLAHFDLKLWLKGCAPPVGADQIVRPRAPDFDLKLWLRVCAAPVAADQIVRPLVH